MKTYDCRDDALLGEDKVEARERNYARWRSWLDKNREAYNTKRRLEARQKAAQRRLNQRPQEQRQEIYSADEEESIAAAAATPPQLKPPQQQHVMMALLLKQNRDDDDEALYWTRKYDPAHTMPRLSGWSLVVWQIHTNAMTHGAHQHFVKI